MADIALTASSGHPCAALRPAKPRRSPDETELSFSERLSAWRVGDRAYMRAYNKTRRAADPAYLAHQQRRAREWKAANPEYVKAARATHYRANKQVAYEHAKRWQRANPAAKARADAAYRAKHGEKIRAAQSSTEFLGRRRARDNARYAANHLERVAKVMRASLLQALRLYADGRKTRSVTKLIGCTIEELVEHLERQFAKGMTWDSHARDGWHIDHIRACATFDLTDPDQQRVCFHFTNLRPLWGAANQTKGKRLTLLL